MYLSTLLVTGNKLHAGDRIFTCAVGKGGFSASKKEGDGATPIGIFPLRECYYRPDRHAAPKTGLPIIAMAADDGWCDAPDSQFYNLPVKTPFNQSHEAMWREDNLYDFVIPMGYNDDPIIPGKGSAIFMHIAKPGYEPTEGCVALSLSDMQALLPLLSVRTLIEIR